MLELSEPVLHLLAADELREAVGDARLGVRFARQRRDLDRIVGDEGRLDEAVLASPLEDLQQQLAPAMARLHLDAKAPAVRGQSLAVAAVRRGDLRVEFAHGFFELPAPRSEEHTSELQSLMR